MSVIRFLIVEDDANTVADWKRAIELHNADDEAHGFRIQSDFADSEASARELLVNRKYDAAIIDLRLRDAAGSGGHNANGNTIAKLVAETAIALIAIYTGQPAEAENFAASTQIRIFEKGEGLEPVMQWLQAGSAIVFQMQQSADQISRHLAGIFHRSIWPRWKFWLAEQSINDRRIALTRHMVSHVHAALLSSTNDKVHSEEWYFVPVPESDGLNTGDVILTSEQTTEVIITPRCDLATEGKTQFVQLATCKSVRDSWENWSDARKREVRQHDKKASQHFLPAMRISDQEIRGPWLVQFDNIRSVARSPENLADLRRRRFATVTAEFLPSLVERLGAYFSRIGTSDVSE